MAEKEWYEDYFGIGTRRIAVYLDAKDRIFVAEDEYRPLPEEHDCDDMGCASVGPHIDSVYLNARKYNDLQAENRLLKKVNEAFEKLRNTAWAKTKGLKTKVDDLRAKIKRLKILLRYVYEIPTNKAGDYSDDSYVVWAEKVQQVLRGDEQ